MKKGKNGKKTRLMLENLKNRLQENNFNEVYVVDTAGEAKDKIMDLIPQGASVGMGGSVTMQQLGVIEDLEKRCRLLRHKPGMPQEERRKIWRDVFSCDFYIASPQAITSRGEMFFIDKYGNRLAAVIFGPAKVVLVAGYNKITGNFSRALWRIRNVAGVKNAVRLNTGAPCTVKMKCKNCSDKSRICNVVSFLLKKPSATDYAIILVNEELGY